MSEGVRLEPVGAHRSAHARIEGFDGILPKQRREDVVDDVGIARVILRMLRDCDEFPVQVLDESGLLPRRAPRPRADALQCIVHVFRKARTLEKIEQ